MACPPHVELAAGLEVPVHPAVDLRDAPGERGPAPGGHDLLVGGGDVGAVQGVQEGFWLPDHDVGVYLEEGVVGQRGLEGGAPGPPLPAALPVDDVQLAPPDAPEVPEAPGVVALVDYEHPGDLGKRLQLLGYGVA